MIFTCGLTHETHSSMKNLSLAQPKVYVIHENPEWAAPLFQELEAIGVPHAEYLAHDALLNAQQEPPPGIYYSKISASAHTRGNDAAIAFALPADPVVGGA